MPEAELICVGDFKTDFRQERPKWQGLFQHRRPLPQAQLNELMKTFDANEGIEAFMQKRKPVWRNR